MGLVEHYISTEPMERHLSRTERQLQRRCAQVLKVARVEAALILIKGAAPGTEAFFAPLLGVFGSLLLRRQFFTLVKCQNELVLLSNRSRLRPAKLIATEHP